MKTNAFPYPEAALELAIKALEREVAAWSETVGVLSLETDPNEFEHAVGIMRELRGAHIEATEVAGKCVMKDPSEAHVREAYEALRRIDLVLDRLFEYETAEPKGYPPEHLALAFTLARLMDETAAGG